MERSDVDSIGSRLRDAYSSVVAPPQEAMLRSARGRRRRARTLSGLLVVAVSVPVVAAAWLAVGAATDVTWAAVPHQLDQSVVASAERSCGTGGMTLDVVDARGRTAVAYYSNGREGVLCRFTIKPDGSIGATDTAGLRLPPSAGALDVITGWYDPANDEPRLVVGHAPGGAASIRLRLVGGQEVTASVDGGYYLAWWPKGSGIESIQAVGPGGSLLQALGPADIP